MKKNIKKWLLTASVDAISIDFETVLFSETEPEFWTCYYIAESNNCVFFSVEELTD